MRSCLRQGANESVQRCLTLDGAELEQCLQRCTAPTTWKVSNLSEFYLWIKVIHVISIISWMAGMLYLPRLFVYHADNQENASQSAVFKVMEFRLLKYIMTPAMLTAWISGLFLAFWASYWSSGWFLAKVTLVLGMTGTHGFLARATRDFAFDRNHRSSRFFRIINEVPTLLMIGIVILVIVRPF